MNHPLLHANLSQDQLTKVWLRFLSLGRGRVQDLEMVWLEAFAGGLMFAWSLVGEEGVQARIRENVVGFVLVEIR